MKNRSFWILPTIIVSQFAGTSLWFAGNAVLEDLQQQLGLGHAVLGSMTSSVQLGFIAGTLVFAFFAVSDRFSPRNVFWVCSLLGATSNLCIYAAAGGLTSLLAYRFLTGFFLAGIYPVGMKIAAGWFKAGLGRALGFLVGALVVGTAFPHLLRSSAHSVPWQYVVLAVSVTSAAGGLLVRLLIPDGPYLAKGTALSGNALGMIFRSKHLRAASFGYFGHMWELYAFWAFIPFFLSGYAEMNAAPLNIPFWSFCIIATGSVGCIAGGLISKKAGSPAVAFYQLTASGLCCLLSPIMFRAPPEFFLGFLLFWGLVVVGDSPQFSTLTAQTAPRELVGSALTIVTSIGFFITIISIQLMNSVTALFASRYIFLFLIPGPILGLFFLWPLLRGFEGIPTRVGGS